MIWNNDIIANPVLPEPLAFGWELVDDDYKPNFIASLPAETLIDLTKCTCSQTKCTTNHCNCKNNNFNGTDLCNCNEESDICETSEKMVVIITKRRKIVIPKSE